MLKLHRKKSGDYITTDNRFRIEKGTSGWNVYETTHRLYPNHEEYRFSADTLREVREELETMKG